MTVVINHKLVPSSSACCQRGEKDCDDRSDDRSICPLDLPHPQTPLNYTSPRSSVRLGILPCFNLLFATYSMRELLPQLTQTGFYHFTSRSHLRFSRRKLNLRCCQLFGLALDIESQNPEQRMSPRTTDSAQPRSVRRFARQTPLVRSSKNLFASSLPLILLYC